MAMLTIFLKMERQIIKSENVVVVPLYFSVFDTGAGDQYFIKTQW
jgi:hypothetical protein